MNITELYQLSLLNPTHSERLRFSQKNHAKLIVMKFREAEPCYFIDKDENAIFSKKTSVASSEGLKSVINKKVLKKDIIIMDLLKLTERSFYIDYRSKIILHLSSRRKMGLNE